MQKIFKMSNLHCADCARALEEAISGIKGVKHASINFVTEKFELEIEDETSEETINKIKKLINDFNNGVTLTEIKDEPEDIFELRLKLENIDCESCASKVVSSVERLKEVQSAEYNKGVLVLYLVEEPSENLFKRIVSLIKNTEPNLKVKAVKDKESTKKVDLKVIFYPIGLILAVFVALANFNVISFSPALYWSILLISAILLGFNTYITAIKMLFKLNINENLLLTISVFGAIAVGEHVEGLMVVALYTFGKILEAKAVNKSRKDIKALMNIQPEYAFVERFGEIKKVRPRLVEVGEIIVVRPGEKIALDGVVIEGSSELDTKSLTGESTPVRKLVGDSCLSGSVVLDSVLRIKVTANYSESTSSKILDLIEKASDKKSKTETFIARFSKYYTLLVVALAVVVGIITGLVLHDASTGIYRGLIFLVISCPCAFAISVPLSYFSGLGNASKKGILIKGTNYLDACSHAGIVAFDKTGTLTTGEFRVQEIEVFEDAYSKEEILEIAGIGEQNSIHPIAKAIVKANEGKNLGHAENVREVAGVGIDFEYDGTVYFVGRDEAESENNTSVVVKKGNITLGKIYLDDEVKKESIVAVSGLKALGVKSIMLTGDNNETARRKAQEIGVSEFKAELLPQDKFNALESLKASTKGNLLYVGDGINDAPSLALADVGISMGINGSPASIEASDVVLVDDNPAKVIDLIRTSKHTKKIVLQNIIFASFIKLSCLILGALGIANMVMAVFADVGVTILAVLNSLRALTYDLKNKK